MYRARERKTLCIYVYTYIYIYVYMISYIEYMCYDYECYNITL